MDKEVQIEQILNFDFSTLTPYISSTVKTASTSTIQVKSQCWHCCPWDSDCRCDEEANVLELIYGPWEEDKLSCDTFINLRSPFAVYFKRNPTEEELRKARECVHEYRPSAFCHEGLRPINDHRLESLIPLPAISINRMTINKGRVNLDQSLELLYGENDPCKYDSSDDPFKYLEVLKKLYEQYEKSNQILTDSAREGANQPGSGQRILLVIDSNWDFFKNIGSFEAYRKRFCIPQQAQDRTRYLSGIPEADQPAEYLRQLICLQENRRALIAERLRKLDENALEEIHGIIDRCRKRAKELEDCDNREGVSTFSRTAWNDGFQKPL